MIGKNIRMIMDGKGLKVKYLADKVGVSKVHLSYILNNKRTPSMELVSKLADELDVTVSELFEGVSTEGAEEESKQDLADFLKRSEIVFDGESYKLDEKDKEEILQALEYAFWKAKKKAHKKDL